MFNVKAYHGSPNGKFDKFDTFPAFTTDCYKAAESYAINNFARDENGYPFVLTVNINMANPKVLTNDELITLIGYDDGIDWTLIDNLCYLFEEEGHDGLVLLGTKDFSGVVNGKRIENTYDQYVIFSHETYSISEI